jgi:hypothetical protein
VIILGILAGVILYYITKVDKEKRLNERENSINKFDMKNESL